MPEANISELLVSMKKHGDYILKSARGFSNKLTLPIIFRPQEIRHIYRFFIKAIMYNTYTIIIIRLSVHGPHTAK